MVNSFGLREQSVANQDADANNKYDRDVCIDLSERKSFEPY